MPFEMTERQVSAVTVLDLAGKLTIDQGAERLKDKIHSLIEQGRTNVVLNLGDLSYIDSGGLGQLIASYSSLMRATGALKLLHVSKRNHDLLSITRLVTLFDTFDSEDEAVRSFQPLAPGSPIAAQTG
jgi:anti-sigma B factor antagonist